MEILPNTTFRIRLEGTDRTVLGVISGRMRKHNIRVSLGDQVEIEFSVYDLSRGRITRRR